MRMTAPKMETALFKGEKLLTGVSALGFLLAVGCGIYVVLFGGIVGPEGNVKDAFSFNAAVALFILSIAAILPVSGLNQRTRLWVRYGFAVTTIISYGIETIQHFRGFNPRYTQAGSILDIVIGGFFGLISTLIIVLTMIVAIAFFRKKQTNSFPLLRLGVRYAFVSVMLAFSAGVVMIILQSRLTGSGGNFIVMHGLGFHALQSLPILGWFLERTNAEKNRLLVHIGGIAWCISVILIGIQTVLGRTVFEFSLLPILSACALFVYFAVLSMVCLILVKPRIFTARPADRLWSRQESED